tara:strand:+ start:550 stop:1170 length:621 start_codon:yes stop_codon:yes gene_type:complete
MKWSGTKELKGSTVKLGDLSPDQENLNHHPEYSYKVLTSSLKRFGQHKPVVVHKGVVICGNGLYEAARRIGWSHIAVSTFDGTDTEAKALAIADNKSPENSYFIDGAIDVVGELLEQFTPEELGGFASLELTDPFDFESEDSGESEAEDSDQPPQKTVRFTSEQWDIVAQVVDFIRQEGGSRLSEGRCLELVCADYMSGIIKEDRA